MNLAYIHISEHLAETARFKPEASGIYFTLMLEYLKAEKPLVDDLDELAFLTHAESPKQREALHFVLKRCFVRTENENGPVTWVSVKCEKMIADFRQNCVQSRYAILCRHWEKVNKGVPKPSHEAFAANPSAYYDETTKRLRIVTGRKVLVLESYPDGSTGEPSPYYAPVTSNQEPVTSNQESTPVVPKGTEMPGVPEWEVIAEAIYGLYPRKVGHKKAIASIVKVLKTGSITELELGEAVRAYAQAVASWPEESRFTREGVDTVPNPATWFNQARYEDDRATWVRTRVQRTEFLGKKERAGAAELSFEDGPQVEVEPAGWRLMWPEVFSGPCPERWDDVPETCKRRLRVEIAKKKEGGGLK